MKIGTLLMLVKMMSPSARNALEAHSTEPGNPSFPSQLDLEQLSPPENHTTLNQPDCQSNLKTWDRIISIHKIGFCLKALNDE